VGFLPYRIVPFVKYKGGGLLGSLVGWALAWRCPVNIWTVTALTALAILVSHRAEKALTHDDPRIVIDETAGIWVAVAGLPRQMGPMLGALLLFRFFDVVKGPWGRAAARLPGGWGVVADDILAGLIANVLVRSFFLFN
jgi:phosphatidylglycerophosphatase A